MPKNFVEEPACTVFQKIPGSEKVNDERGGGGREYHDFLSKIFCLTVLKNFVVLCFPSVFHKISGIEKKLWIRGEGGVEYQDLPSNFFLSHSAEKFRGGTL